MACRQLKMWWVFVSLSLLCQSGEALISTRHSKTVAEPQRAETNISDVQNQRKRSKDSETLYSGQFSRRNLFRQSGIASTTIFLTSIYSQKPLPAQAADTLDSYLYKIIRVREATQQERRLIQSGKFKDMQRANVKLAVKFMVQNYRLSDSVVGASTFLSGGNSQQMRAIDTGQMAVQNLQTILEYFDTSDVENIKVGKNSMSGKEEIVVRGLEATQIKLDEFLSFFDEGTVTRVKDQVQEENDLNMKEFDKSLGDIINLKPPS